jgi:hypothetical protein
LHEIYNNQKHCISIITVNQYNIGKRTGINRLIVAK